jgi:hypothetical protein
MVAGEGTVIVVHEKLRGGAGLAKVVQVFCDFRALISTT